MSSAAPSSPQPLTPYMGSVDRSRRWGWASTICAVLAAIGFGWTWSYSVTDFDPVPWLRIPLILLMPLGLVAAILCAVIAWPGAGRRLAILGLTLSAVVLAAFIILLNVMT